MALTKITSKVLPNTAITGALGYTPANKAGDTFSGPIAFSDATQFGTGYSLGMRNRIINGDMRIDQRNVGASVSCPAGTIQSFITDRWWAQRYGDAASFTAQQSTNAPAGFINSMVFTTGTSGSITGSNTSFVAQRIEGLNVTDLGWGTSSAQAVTLSFWTRSSLTGSFSGALTNSGSSRSYPFSFTINAANTWEQKIITVAGDTSGTWLTTNGTGIQLTFDLGNGPTVRGTAGSWAGATYLGVTGAVSLVGTTGATFYITGVQLEKGSTASPFEWRPYGTELVLCQRYYEKSFDDGVAPADGATSDRRAGPGAVYNGTNWDGGFVSYKATKRVIPTVTFYRPNFGAGSGVWILYESGTSWVAHTMTASGSGVTGFIPGCTLTTGSNGQSIMSSGHWAAVAEM